MMFILFVSHPITRPFRNTFAEMVLIYCISSSLQEEALALIVVTSEMQSCPSNVY